MKKKYKKPNIFDSEKIQMAVPAVLAKAALAGAAAGAVTQVMRGDFDHKLKDRLIAKQI